MITSLEIHETTFTVIYYTKNAIFLLSVKHYLLESVFA